MALKQLKRLIAEYIREEVGDDTFLLETRYKPCLENLVKYLGWTDERTKSLLVKIPKEI